MFSVFNSGGRTGVTQGITTLNLSSSTAGVEVTLE